MKRPLLLCTFLLTLVLCFGCSKKSEFKVPVNLYYPNSEITFGHDSSVISAEIRECEGLSTDEIVRLYLAGPSDQSFQSPFPKETALIAMQTEGKTVTITVSDAYASLSGYSLTIANISLSKTLMDLTNLDCVVICCETKTIGGEPQIELTKENTILSDESTG